MQHGTNGSDLEENLENEEANDNEVEENNNIMTYFIPLKNFMKKWRNY